MGLVPRISHLFCFQPTLNSPLHNLYGNLFSFIAVNNRNFFCSFSLPGWRAAQKGSP
jgi:hypothetical protein